MRPPDMLFAQIIVGIALQPHSDARRQKGAQTLSGDSFKMTADGVLGQTPGAMSRHNLTAEPGTHRAMHIADRQVDAHLLLLFNAPADTGESVHDRASRSWLASTGRVQRRIAVLGIRLQQGSLKSRVAAFQ